jgi:hypothetical protein
MFKLVKWSLAVAALSLAGTACQVPTSGQDEPVAASSSRPGLNAEAATSAGGAIGSGNMDAASDSTTAISGGGAIGSGNRGGGAIGSGN